ncbi:ImmA/IrrE family metallo-endopeptidase [Bacillus solitudinis]|uniref:ImmA/IrrE family metallo-endopeptidase n=1 Tax=Bacillus solitudinis TaxID=2014074 RepID=UPI000C25109D|nr:ImmA/IrrE family metallo-endopeptidase [Bacillus solitudinis]
MRYATFKEQKITEIMKSKGILTVQDLHIDNVCEVFKIDLIFHPRRCNCINEDEDDYAVIFVDNRLPYQEQRYKFFHELSHVLFHPGNQKEMTSEMEQLQENQARWITLYSSMPRHIFEPMAIRYQSIEKLQELFDLPQQYIIERFQTIQRERLRQQFQNRLKRSEMSRRKKSLQPGLVYDSTLSILNQLKKQVGEDKLNYDVKRLLR